MPEDISTLATRKLLIAIARSFIGSHYLHGTAGEVPDTGDKLMMMPNTVEPFTMAALPGVTEWATIYTARNGMDEGKKKRCTGRSGHKEVEKMTKGDHTNAAHLANPDGYRWQRLVKLNNQNPLYGESCIGKAHFDCIGFIKFCLSQVIPEFTTHLRSNKAFWGISGMRSQLEPVNKSGVNASDLCAGDILIRNDNGHIGFATGDGQRVVQAEWEPTGVVDTKLGPWEYHGRIKQEWWLRFAPSEDY